MQVSQFCNSKLCYQRQGLSRQLNYQIKQDKQILKKNGTSLQKQFSQTTDVKQLKSQFDIEDLVQVLEGEGGLTKVKLQSTAGTSVEVYTFGANMTSWKQQSGDEVIFIRPDIVYDGKKDLKGGTPHCFPQFGPGKMQQHGFARNLPWEINSVSANPTPDERDPEVTFKLVPNDYTKQMFPYDFNLYYSVSLHGNQVKLSYRVVNTGTEEFDFTAALHTYFQIVNLKQTRVVGLNGLEYLDKVPDAKNPQKKKFEEKYLTFPGCLVDRVYLNAPEQVTLDVGTGVGIQITATGWSDIVTWSPGETMEELKDKFVCVENAQIKPVVVKTGSFWKGSIEYEIVDLK